MPHKAIECIDLNCVFRGKDKDGNRTSTNALGGVTFDVARGTIFGLLGPNGAGKTTTVRILSTLLEPTRGRAMVMGSDVMKERAKVRREIGLVLGGDLGFYDQLSGYQNLKFFAALGHNLNKSIREEIDKSLELVGIEGWVHQPVGQYSRGMKQRLHLARSILFTPTVLFLDEPTIGLDPSSMKDIRKMIIDIKKEYGTTVFLTTHYMAEADELCDKVAIVNNGKIQIQGTPAELKKNSKQARKLELLVTSTSVQKESLLRAADWVDSFSQSHDGHHTKYLINIAISENINKRIFEVFDISSIKSMTLREPSLEEAYIDVIRNISN